MSYKRAVCFEEVTGRGFWDLFHAHREFRCILWVQVHAIGCSLGNYSHSTPFQFKRAWPPFFT